MESRADDVSGARVIIHTDGACSGNPGPGGWGAILQWNGHTRELKGGEPHTTNNRMELMAAIMALEALKRSCAAEVHTDSQYLRDGITKWIHGWKRNGWRTAAMPSRASSSARSLRSWPAWPRTQCQVTWCRASAVSRRCHNSAFFTGFFSAVRAGAKGALATRE